MITNKEIQENSKILANRIRDKGIRYDLILTITSGGLIPTYYIAKQLGIKIIEVLNINSYINKKQEYIVDLTIFKKDFSDKNVLLIDDLVDTGKTIKYVKDNYIFKRLDIATLYHKQGSLIYPNECYIYNIPSCIWLEFEYENNSI